MRPSSITLFSALALLAVLGCGGGQGAPPSGTAGPIDNSAYQKPPSTYESPPAPQTGSDYQKPPSTYQAGSSYQGGPSSTGSSPSGSGSTVCDVYCGAAANAQCGPSQGDAGVDLPGLPLDQCLSTCKGALGTVPCATELGPALDCVFAQMAPSCDDLRQLQDGDTSGLDQNAVQACASQANAYLTCLEQNDQGNKPPNNRCTPPNACGGCADACARCRCEYSDNLDMCTALCS